MSFANEQGTRTDSVVRSKRSWPWQIVIWIQSKSIGYFQNGWSYSRWFPLTNLGGKVFFVIIWCYFIWKGHSLSVVTFLSFVILTQCCLNSNIFFVKYSNCPLIVTSHVQWGKSKCSLILKFTFWNNLIPQAGRHLQKIKAVNTEVRWLQLGS